MKTKDIVAIVLCVVIIGVSVYFLLGFIFPKGSSQKTVTTNTQTQQNQFSGDIDTDTYNKIKDFTDYGEAKLEGIGKVNPFGPLN